MVIDELRARGVDVLDLGTNDAASVDYPDYAAQVARIVAAGEASFGVLLCSTGVGMAIAANKFHGIRAALVHDVTTAHLAREHNNANILVLGGALLGDRILREIVRTWLDSAFEGGRHQRRVDKIGVLEDAERPTAQPKPQPNPKEQS